MIALVEGAERQKTPNEIALNILLAGLTIIFLLAVVTLQPFAIYSGAEQTIIVLVALLVCLIPTTIGALLSAIGIAGMDRLVQRNVPGDVGRAVEAAGDVLDAAARQDRHDHARQPPGRRVPARARRRPSRELADAAQLCRASPTRRPRAARSSCSPRSATGSASRELVGTPTLVPFTAQTRMSGVDLDGRRIRKGAADSVRAGSSRGRHGPRGARHDRRTASRAAAARRSSSPSSADGRRPRIARRRSTSRTSSRTACASGSTSCGRWASAP